MRSLLMGNISVSRHLQRNYHVGQINKVRGWSRPARILDGAGSTSNRLYLANRILLNKQFYCLFSSYANMTMKHLKLWNIFLGYVENYPFFIVTYHVTEGFGCPYARHRSVAGAPRLRYISAEQRNVKRAHPPHKFSVIRKIGYCGKNCPKIRSFIRVQDIKHYSKAAVWQESCSRE